MPLSKHYLDINTEPVAFDVDALGGALENGCAEAVFVYLMGSAADGTVPAHGDVDLAFYLAGKPDLAFYNNVLEICRTLLGGIRVDIGILNRAEPVYAFEALRGRLLFTRDEERWLTFYSVTCREYEHQIVHYERQKRYRLEGRGLEAKHAD